MIHSSSISSLHKILDDLGMPLPLHIYQCSALSFEDLRLQYIYFLGQSKWDGREVPPSLDTSTGWRNLSYVVQPDTYLEHSAFTKSSNYKDWCKFENDSFGISDSTTVLLLSMLKLLYCCRVLFGSCSSSLNC